MQISGYCHTSRPNASLLSNLLFWAVVASLGKSVTWRRIKIAIGKGKKLLDSFHDFFLIKCGKVFHLKYLDYRSANLCGKPKTAHL